MVQIKRKPLGVRLILIFVLLHFIKDVVHAQNASPTLVSCFRVPCPFDSSRAKLKVTCGKMVVPENYDDHQSRMIEIAFMVVKANKNRDPDHPVLFLNGGPGQTSLYFAETLVCDSLIYSVVVDRDWVFFDQRGTGRSIPRLYCSDEKDNPLDLKKCRANFLEEGIDLSQYNSKRISMDMEELRKCLSVSQWNLWGISYGSRLALNMAGYFPSSVRSIIHDSPGLPEGQERVDDALGFDAALHKLFTKCQNDPSCSALYPNLEYSFIQSIVQLRKKPILINEKEFNDVNILGFIFNWLYPRGISSYEHRIQNLLIFMNAVAQFNGKRMVETQMEMRKEEGLDNPRPPEPLYARYCIGQNLSVYCNERRPFERREDYEKAIARSEIARSFLSGFEDSSECDIWPSGKGEQIVNSHVSFDGPQLAFTGELDPSSSGLAGEKIVVMYYNAKNIVFKNGYHGQFPTELPSAEDMDYWFCAMKLAQIFLNDPGASLDANCAETRKLKLIR